MSQESSEDENAKKSARLEVFATDGAEQTIRVTLRKGALVMDLRKQIKKATGCSTPHPSIKIRDPARPGQYLSSTKPITAEQTYTFEIPPPPLSGEEPERLDNRWRGYLQDPSQHQNLVEELQRIAQRKDAGPDSDGRLCQPLAVQDTFGLKEWGETLIEARKELQGLDASDTAESRSPRVLSLVAGTGFGKTHAMLHSAEAIKAASGEDPELLYMTYNLSQPLELDVDVALSQTAVLLRVLLCRLGFTNVTTGEVLAELNAALSSLKPGRKQWLEVVFQHIKTVRRPHHVVVCVDECRNIGQAAQQVASILGELAFRLEQEGIRCTVLLSSLASRTFVSSSARPTETVVLPRANNAAEFVLQEILPKANDRQKAMVTGAGGAHWRSLVTMCKWLSESSEVAVQHLYRTLAKRLRTRLSLEEQLALMQYIRNTVSEGRVSALRTNPEAEIMVDGSMAVPPAIVFTIFDEADGIPRGEHPAQQLYECSVFVGPSKQLENSGMHYDRFRALYKLPVLPRGIPVSNATGNGGWFRSLVFPFRVAHKENLVEESLLHVKGKDKRVQRTDVQPMVGKYYLPKNESHPWVDRAVVTHAPGDTSSTCLVLYQDKINASGFPEAVKELNEAAKLFVSDFTNVLCVACVMGASSETTAQAAFEFPYVLVRNHEVSSFFTPTFAQAIHVLRQRHCVPRWLVQHDDGDEHRGQLPLRLQLAD